MSSLRSFYKPFSKDFFQGMLILGYVLTRTWVWVTLCILVLVGALISIALKEEAAFGRDCQAACGALPVIDCVVVEGSKVRAVCNKAVEIREAPRFTTTEK